MARRARTNALVLLGYIAVAFTYFGWRIAAHPGRYILGSGRDPQIFIWSFAWWPHAVETWQNPFFSHAIYAPDGINLTWATSVPGLAFAFWPVTALFGPTAAYNLAAMLAPALSAWTAFLLCRYLTKSLWAGLIGGYLFGFSSYELGQELGHLHLTAVFLVPLIALTAVRYVRAEIGPRALVLRLGVLLGLQLWISTEITFTVTLALLVGLGLAYWIVPDARPRLRGGARPLAAAFGVATLVAAPLVAYLLIGFTGNSVNAAPSGFDADLLNFIVPTHLTAISGWFTSSIANHFRGNDAERGAYLGLPALAIIGWYAVRSWRAASTRLLVALLGVAALLTLGTGVAIQGRIRLWLPWSEIARAPIFDNVLPGRFALFCSLAAAVMVAIWTASRRSLLLRALPLVAVAALVPEFWQADYRTAPERWPYFTEGMYKCIPRGDNVAIFPFGAWGDSMLWQAETGFWFRIAEGNLVPHPPAKFLADPTVQLLTNTLDNPSIPDIISFVKDKKVDRIISVNIYVHPNGTEMHSFGPVGGGGGVLVAPDCSYPSMQKGIHPTPPHPAG